MFHDTEKRTRTLAWFHEKKSFFQASTRAQSSMPICFSFMTLAQLTELHCLSLSPMVLCCGKFTSMVPSAGFLDTADPSLACQAFGGLLGHMRVHAYLG
jgi:hypothetical protein